MIKKNLSSTQGRRLHHLAEEAREQGKFLEALELTDRATLEYAKDDDLSGLAEVQSSRQSTFKHLFRRTGKKVFLDLEKYAALSAVEIAQLSGINEALGIPYHNLGKYYFEVKDYRKAAEYFQKAIDNLKQFPSKRHSRASVIADIAGHLYAAEYKAGDKTALAGALKALEDLENAKEESSYNKNVWVSGAHLRIAHMLLKDQPEISRKHLKRAEKIIRADKRLSLRLDQLKQVYKQLNS